MEKYSVKRKYELITTNTSVSAADFGGWQAANIGDTPCIVDGVLLDPTGAIIGIDFTKLLPNVVWESDINIRFVEPIGTNPRIVLTRLKYTKK